MSDDSQVHEGSIIDGRYRIVRKIADGGMATVYMAHDERLDRTVAIKIMHIQLAQGPHRAQFVERFRREAKSAAAIANPHIVQVYDSGEHAGLDYLVMEFVQGMNLRQSMNRNTTFSVRETLRLVGETLNGLSAAHNAGVVHRDIKPENILLNRRGRVQITDFGLAKAVSQATLSTTGMLLGTAAYLAPEMIEQNLATPQGDCYSVGIMAWEMLAGQVPFQSDNPVTLVFKHVNENVPSIATVCHGIDPRVADFISYLTARQVDRRPPNAGEALNRLHGLIHELPAAALDYRYDPSMNLLNTLHDLNSGALPAHFATSDATSAQVHEMWRDNEVRSEAPTSAAGVSTDPDIPPSAGAAAESNVSATASDDEPPTQVMGSNEYRPATATTVLESDGTVPMPKSKHGRHRTGTELTGASPTAHNEQPRKHRKGLIAGLIALAVLVLAGGGVAFWHFLGPGSYWTLPQPTGLDCASQTHCRIENVSWTTYQQELDAHGIPYEVIEEYSDTVRSGNIISTNPSDVNAHVSKRTGEALQVTISKGVRQAVVPTDILDPNSTAGKDPVKALEDAGFDNVIHNADNDQWSVTVPAGAAISVSPEPGTAADHDAQVTVVLSKGPMPVSMPDVVGKSRTDAAELLDAAKLVVTYNEEYSDSVPNGTVISSDPASGTQLKWGDAVTVTVSKGPEMVTVPNVVGKSTSEATQILEGLGLKVKTTAPLGDITHTVRIQSPRADESVRLRDANGDPTVITLTIV